MRHMRRVSFADMNCSIAQALEIIGEWWTPLILRDAFLGVTRFEEFHDRLGISRNILSARLDTLVDAGVMERRTYEEARGRCDYVLTNMGRELWPVLTTLRQWGDKWLLGKDNAPTILVHTTCGARATAELVCSECGEHLHRRDIRMVGGSVQSSDDRAQTNTR
jgi:DNA-binding HxlR family transcriptional regulator